MKKSNKVIRDNIILTLMGLCTTYIVGNCVYHTWFADKPQATGEQKTAYEKGVAVVKEKFDKFRETSTKKEGDFPASRKNEPIRFSSVDEQPKKKSCSKLFGDTLTQGSRRNNAPIREERVKPIKRDSRRRVEVVREKEKPIVIQSQSRESTFIYAISSQLKSNQFAIDLVSEEGTAGRIVFEISGISENKINLITTEFRRENYSLEGDMHLNIVYRDKKDRRREGFGFSIKIDKKDGVSLEPYTRDTNNTVFIGAKESIGVKYKNKYYVSYVNGVVNFAGKYKRTRTQNSLQTRQIKLSAINKPNHLNNKMIGKRNIKILVGQSRVYC